MGNDSDNGVFTGDSSQSDVACCAIFSAWYIRDLAKSDLKFPEPLYLGLTIYLLTCIGFKGGVSIAKAGIATVWLPAIGAAMLGVFIPLWCFPILRWLGRMAAVDAAAIAAHYGSCSAVTFIAATNFLKAIGTPFEDHAAAFLAVMESPAIVVGVILGKMATQSANESFWPMLKQSLHEALLGRSVVLLVGGLVVGFLSGERGLESTSGFFVAPFQGVLALFLLEMGMVAARRFRDLKKVGLFLIGFGVLIPILNGCVGVALGQMLGLSLGGAMLMGVLASSASYIAAPAAIRISLPDANPTLYLTAALAITFPFNITIGLPIYFELAKRFFGELG